MLLKNFLIFFFHKSPKNSYSHYFLANMNLSLLPYLTLIVVSKIRLVPQVLPVALPQVLPVPQIQNSEFKIQNLPIPLALFTAHYRLEKLFSLLCIKENNRLVFCIMLIFNVINF